MKKIQPFIWFKENGKEAMELYTTLFANSSVGRVTMLPDAPGPAGQFVGEFELMGEKFMCIQGGENPMLAAPGPISLVVECDTQEEIDKLWDAFKDGGKEIQCGWITDPFGITWQIVPSILGQLMSDPDKEKAHRTTMAMMGMVKLDIAALQRAHDGE
jgi:predicted 3-demethylubiquinone-9 3-methyltransferase (glyoxalase superfamily)